MPSLIENHLELFELFYAHAESQRDIQAGRRCGSLAADNRQLELNTKLIGWPFFGDLVIWNYRDKLTKFHDVIIDVIRSKDCIH